MSTAYHIITIAGIMPDPLPLEPIASPKVQARITVAFEMVELKQQ